MSLIIWDTETTGLVENRSMKIDRQPEVIQFSAVIVDGWDNETTPTMNFLIKPRNPIPEANVKITGITNEMVADCPPFSHFADQIIEAIEGATYAVAHNARFDRDMVDLELERMGKTLNWPEVVCSIEATAHLHGGRISLGALYKRLFDETLVGAHNAMNDTLGLYRCLKELHARGEFPYE